MLQLFTDGQPTDLSDDISIDLVFENPLFSTDRIPTSYSLSYDLPLTPKNRQLFGNPDRIASAGDRFRERPTRIFFAGIEIASGVQTLEEISDVITVNFSGRILPAALNRKLYHVEMDKIPLAYNGAYAVETSMTVWDGILRSNMKDPDAPFAAPPIAIKDVEMQERDPDNPEDFLLNTRSMWINPMHISAHSYEHFLKNSGERFYLLKILPAVRVWYLFDKIFGDKLDRNIFKEGEWRKLSLQSTWHPSYNITDNLPCWVPDTDAWGNAGYAVRIEDFMPDVSTSEFVVEMLKLPCASMYIRGDRFSVEYNADLLDRKVIRDIRPDRLIGTPVITREAGQRYTAGYADSGEGGQPEGEIKDVENILEGIHYMASRAFKTDGTGVATSVRVQAPRQTLTVILDKASRAYYAVKEEDMPADAATDTETEETEEADSSGYDMTVNAKRVKCVANRYWLNDDDIGTNWFRHILCPEIEQPGTKRPDEMLIGLYQGMQSEIQQWIMNPDYTPNTFPALSATNSGANGERYGDLSLYWHGPDGLLVRHKRFAEWLAKDRMVVRAEVLLSPLELHNLDLRDKFALHGRHFFIRTMNVSIKKNTIEPAEVEFVEV